MDKVIYIYTLADPRTDETRYVGKTHSLKKRFAQTLSDKAKPHKTNWIKMLSELGMKPIMEVLEITTSNSWVADERYWITQLKAWGFNLLNATDGGEGILGATLNLTEQDRLSRGKRSEKIVIQYNSCHVEVGRFSSLKEAVNKFGNQISRAVAGKRKTAYGFIWKYEKSFKPRNVTVGSVVKENRRTFIKTVQEMNRKPLNVFDKNNNKIGAFLSVGDAAKEYSILGTAIANQLKGRSKSCNNKIFIYA